MNYSMQINTKNTISLFTIILRIAAWLTGLVLVFITLATLGWYFPVLFYIFLGLFAMLAFFDIRNLLKRSKLVIAKSDVIVLILILAFTTFIGVFHHEMPRGRDDMSYIFSAIEISKTGSLEFTDQMARPFHGMTNVEGDTFTSQFLPAYATWISVIFRFGGINALPFANAILLFFSLSAIFYTGKQLSNLKGGILALLFFATFFTSWWFFRRTNSENLLMMVFWVAASFLVTSYKQRSYKQALIGISIMSVALLTRPEGMFYFVMALVVIGYLLISRRVKFGFKSGFLWLMPALSVFTYLFYLQKFNAAGYIEGQFHSFAYFLEDTQKVILGIIALVLAIIVYIFARKKEFLVNKFIGVASILAIGTFTFFVQNKINGSPDVDWGIYRMWFVFSTFIAYFLIVYIAIVVIGFFTKSFQKASFIVIALCLPTFVFLLEPGIGLDQPWFLRRYWPVFIPLVMVLAGVVLANLRINKKQLAMIATVLLAINLLVSYPIIAWSEHGGVNDQLAKIASRFGENDLILMQPGWHWQQWAYAWHFVHELDILPTMKGYDDQAELSEIISRYDNVYVVTDRLTDMHTVYADNNLKRIDEIDLQYEELTRVTKITEYIKKSAPMVNATRINQALDELPPGNIGEVDEDLYLFEVINPKLIQSYN